MTEFYLSLIIVTLAITGMALGVILSNKELKGSCGGLGAVMGDDCMYCEKKDECEELKASSEKAPDLLKMIEG